MVQNITSVVLPEEELLRLTATAEQLSTHPIAISIKKAMAKKLFQQQQLKRLPDTVSKPQLKAKQF